MRFVRFALLLGMIFAGTLVASSQAAPKYRTHFVTYDVQTKATSDLFTLDGEWHAPNWTPDGKYIVSDMGNALYRIPVSGAEKGKPEKIYSDASRVATNDHAVSWDGKQIADTVIKLPMPAKIRGAADIPNPIVVMNLDGSAVREVHTGWLHGWSPDGKYLLYTGTRQDSASIYRINVDGSSEMRMTTAKGADDGPEYSADGKWVYFCSNRAGKWDAWRMPAEGAGPEDKLAEKVTSSADGQEWFPHVSPDGKWLYVISYPMNHPDHNYIGEGMRIRMLRLDGGMAAKGAELTTVRTFFGGQGAANTGGWSADSGKFTWTEYEKVAAGK